MMRSVILFSCILLLSASPVFSQKSKQTSPALPFDTTITNSISFREIGPWRGGRSTAVAADPVNKQVFYFGSTGGGVWKTTDGGNNWHNISDGFFGGSVGAIAVSPSDPAILYVGMGENSMRGNVSEGFGVWKSVNSGRTWSFVGLPDTRHIMQIVVHPKNPDIVYCAALGHLFGPNTERGIYKSIDGGKNWKQILFVDAQTGASDLVMDPGDPDILLAGFWQVKRSPYALESGGPGSGIYKTVDGGNTWTEITHQKGLPTDTLGIIGLSISPVNPSVYYAIIEAKNGGVFSSKDAGKTWSKVSEDPNVRQRAWYFSKIYCDTKEVNTIYVLNVEFWKSTDGGGHFSSISTPHGDHHQFWIDPQDNQRMIIADDGGAQVSFNGGNTWSSYYNQPTAQIYRVSTDNAVPYRILGAQQDNSSLRIRHQGKYGEINRNDWEPTAGFESGFIVADPLNPDIVYGGNYSGYIGCYNHITDDERNITVWPDDPIGQGADVQKYRFQWNFPILFSVHNPKRLYAAGNVLFYTEDYGTTWIAMSPDLTTNDKSKQQKSGGIITKDNTGVEVYCTIFAVAESPVEKGVIYTGSDDGLIYITKDDGANWQNITPKDLPAWTQINALEADPNRKGTLYVAATRYKSDDFTPYIYVTHDYGTTWKRITTGIAPTHFTRVVRADKVREGLLYCGTEYGLYVSYDDGANWHPLQFNVPLVPITDMTIKNNDLIIATQGRGFWMLDDLSVLQEMGVSLKKDAFHALPARDAYLIGGWQNEEPRNAGKNPLPGAVFNFWVPKMQNAKGYDSVAACSIEIRDQNEKIARTFSTSATQKEDQISLHPGLNHLNWDLHYTGGISIDGMFLWNGVPGGPAAAPGSYSAKIKYGADSAILTFEVLPDPNSMATKTDYIEQHAFLMEVLELFNKTQNSIKEMQALQKQMADYQQKLDTLAPQSLKDSFAEIDADITTILNNLYETRNKSNQDMLNYGIKLNDKLSGLYNAVASGNFKPSVNQKLVFEDLETQINDLLAAYEKMVLVKVAGLNAQIHTLNLPIIISN